MGCLGLGKGKAGVGRPLRLSLCSAHGGEGQTAGLFALCVKADLEGRVLGFELVQGLTYFSELRLDFDFPTKWLKNTFIKKASIGVYGRNLLCITDYPMFDPETVSLDGSTMVTGVEVGTLPSTRSYGINFNVSF